MSLSRVNVEASVTGSPAHYTQARKSSTMTATSNGPAKNTRAERAASGEHLTRMMKVVARMKEKTDSYQKEALIELANSVIDTDIGRILEYRHLKRYLNYKDAWNISAANEFG